MTKVRTRFAPSPTGYIHIGSVYQILFNYGYAKANNGEFLLRIEDTDRRRYVEGSEDSIYQAFDWLGISFNGEPVKQSNRLAIYKKYAEQLVKQGDAYYCFCSEERLKKVREQCHQNKQNPKYDRHCRNIDPKEARARVEAGEKYVIRMKIPDDKTIIVNDLIRGEVRFDSNTIDDQVLLKADGFPTYHLAVVVDDHLMEISHVVRGQEWLPSAPKHVLLYQYFGWEMPVLFHSPVLLDPDGGKLSKRKGHTSLSWYIKEGFLPEALLNFLALQGWSHPQEKEIFSLKEFIKHFDLKDVSPVGPVFDLTKLEWMNGEYIRACSDKKLAKLLKPFLPNLSDQQIKQATPIIKERIKKLSEAKDLLVFINKARGYDKKLLLQRGLDNKTAKRILEQIKKIILKYGVNDSTKLQKLFMKLIKDNSYKTGAFFMVLRVAICHSKITPPITESLALLSKEEVIKRLDLAISKLEK